MSLETLALITLVLAALPCGLFLLNLLVYRPLRKPGVNETCPAMGVSVVIPARKE